MLNNVSTLYKYPRTPHLSFSPGVNEDDIKNRETLDEAFEMDHCVLTEKMDGENTTLYPDYIHARSLDSKDHPSRHWIKGFWSNIRYQILDGYRICGENMYAKHSIFYENLPSYFLGFSMWYEDTCLDWNETQDWFDKLGIVSVPVLYVGNGAVSKLKQILTHPNHNKREGYVIRTSGSFNYYDLQYYVAKWVRPNHIQTDEHWMSQPVVPNKLNISE